MTKLWTSGPAKRERNYEVIGLVGSGMTQVDVARWFGISPIRVRQIVAYYRRHGDGKLLSRMETK